MWYTITGAFVLVGFSGDHIFLKVELFIEWSCIFPKGKKWFYFTYFIFLLALWDIKSIVWLQIENSKVKFILNIISWYRWLQALAKNMQFGSAIFKDLALMITAPL